MPCGRCIRRRAGRLLPVFGPAAARAAVTTRALGTGVDLVHRALETVAQDLANGGDAAGHDVRYLGPLFGGKRGEEKIRDLPDVRPPQMALEILG